MAMSFRTIVAPSLILVAFGAGLWFLGDRTTWLTNARAWLPGFEPLVFPSVGERRVSAKSYVLALGSDEKLYGWGDNQLGQLSDVPPEEHLAPVAVAKDTATWRYIAAGDEASYAISEAGVLLRRLHSRPRNRSIVTAFHPLFARLSTQELVFWTKVQELKGMAIGLAWNGRLFVWREKELTDGRFCIAPPDAGVECISLDPDGSPRYRTEVEIEADEADRLARLEQQLLQQTEELQSYWKSQPRGHNSPKAQDALRELANKQQTDRKELRDMLQRRREYASKARWIEVPMSISGRRNDWADFCLNGPETAYAVDRTGALWRIDLEPRVRAFFADAKVEVQQIPAPVKIERLFCSVFRAFGEEEDKSADRVFALDADQHLWGFGLNEYGSLWPEPGKATETIPENAMRKLSDDRWVMVVPTANFTVGLRTDGTLWVWGAVYDSVIKKTTRSGKEPIQVGEDEGWVEVDAGDLFIVARSARGEHFTWGTNDNGVLGDPEASYFRDNPGRVVGLPQLPSGADSP